jgi:hypothetical protein
MMAEADSVDDVWKWIRNDIYYTTGVWDTEKVRASSISLTRATQNRKLIRVRADPSLSVQECSETGAAISVVLITHVVLATT